MFVAGTVMKFGVVAAGVLFGAVACTGRTGIAHTDSPAPASATRSPSTGASPTSPGTADGGPVAGACRTQDMVVRLGQPDSAKFQEGTVIELANTGEACVVSGYLLGLRLLDQKGRPDAHHCPEAARHTTAAPVTLARGGRAYATLVWNKYQGQGTSCQPYPASIAVSLPGQTSTVTAPWISGDDGSACQGVLHRRGATGCAVERSDGDGCWSALRRLMANSARAGTDRRPPRPRSTRSTQPTTATWWPWPTCSPATSMMHTTSRSRCSAEPGSAGARWSRTTTRWPG